MLCLLRYSLPLFVALRKESVDRNVILDWIKRQCTKSLSARRAWIEIRSCGYGFETSFWSLSARRAWIEIYLPEYSGYPTSVALRKESVDRNINTIVTRHTLISTLSARRPWIAI